MYFLYYQRRYGERILIAKSISLLKLLKIKKVTYNNDIRAQITNESFRETFNKFDLSADECARYSDFEMKVNSGRYFATYDYNVYKED